MENKRFTDFYEAYTFLNNHNMVNKYRSEKAKELGVKKNYFEKCLTMEVVKVNPLNCEIDSDDSLNTKTKVWLEFGEWNEEDKIPVHDYDLDCGGDTFEEAIIKLANLVNENYHDTGYCKKDMDVCDVCGEKVKSIYSDIETNLKGHKRCLMNKKHGQ